MSYIKKLHQIHQIKKVAYRIIVVGVTYFSKPVIKIDHILLAFSEVISCIPIDVCILD